MQGVEVGNLSRSLALRSCGRTDETGLKPCLVFRSVWDSRIASSHSHRAARTSSACSS
ncbi:MAG: hypothetical protein WC483_03865 [Candidatus Paceibacterota bacterium]